MSFRVCQSRKHSHKYLQFQLSSILLIRLTSAVAVMWFPRHCGNLHQEGTLKKKKKQVLKYYTLCAKNHMHQNLQFQVLIPLLIILLFLLLFQTIVLRHMQQPFQCQIFLTLLLYFVTCFTILLHFSSQRFRVFHLIQSVRHSIGLLEQGDRTLETPLHTSDNTQKLWKKHPSRERELDPRPQHSGSQRQCAYQAKEALRQAEDYFSFKNTET